MKRRDIIKLISAGILIPPEVWAAGCEKPTAVPCNEEDHVKDQLYKTRNPNRHYDDDIYATEADIPHLKSALKRLSRIQGTVGYGNFNILSFDLALRTAKQYSRVKPFTRPELDVLEKLFYSNASDYGFLGEKPVDNITTGISRKDVVKVPRSGHFLYRGEASELFDKVRAEVGPSLILTSGIRSITKQMYLFLRKANKYDWNLSLASRSLAPPGYSFHGVGDFDVGKQGLAGKNFTNAFANTREFKKLVDLGYIDIRYPIDNQLGVRFEPWHIKVV